MRERERDPAGDETTEQKASIKKAGGTKEKVRLDRPAGLR